MADKNISNFSKIIGAFAPLAIFAVLVFPQPAGATLYAPGETLAPDCAPPTSPTCGVIAPIYTTDTKSDGALVFASPTSWSLLPAGTDGQVLKISGGNPAWDSISTDHGVLDGLLNDDHTQYSLLAGRAGGQTLIGGTAVTDILKLQGTSGNGTLTSPAIQALVGNAGATTALTILNNGNVGIGTAAPLQKLDIEKGHIRLGQVAAPTAPTVATGAAGVLTGNYYYRISFVTALGETESGTVSALVAPAAQKVELTNIPVSSDSAVTSRKIYRTTAGGSSDSMKLVATIADNTTTVYSDNIADGSLGVSNPTVNSTGGLIYNGIVRAGIIDNGTTAIGMNALRVNTGYSNSAMGLNALYSNTTGNRNSAMGVQALFSNTTGYFNSAIGSYALNTSTTGYYNSAMGVQALFSNTTGYSNSAMGTRALYSNTTGYQNSAMGRETLFNLAGAYHNNTAIGYNAGAFQADGTTALTTPSQSVYIGSGAMGYNDSDVNSIVIGYLAKGIGANSVVLGNDSITTTALKGNVGIGTTAPLQKLDIEKGHIRLGQVAAPSAPTVATGAAGVLTGNYYYRISFVTALGETESGTLSALVAPAAQKVELTNIPVSSDSAVTSRRIYRTTAGGSTTSMKLVATIADNTTTTYSDNIADGSLGVYNPTVNSTGGLIYNGTVRAGIIDNGTTAIGMNALRVNTGFYNTAIGYSALYSNTTGYFNSFMGKDAGYSNTIGNRNSAIGYSTLYTNTTGYYNSAMGYNALYSNTIGNRNSAIGHSTLYTNTIGYYNSAMGYSALYSNTTGFNNSAVGVQALYNLAGAYHNNTALGFQAGRYQADGTTALATPSQSVYIGSGAMGYNNSDVNSIVIGYLAKGIGANSVVLGNDSITTTALKGNVGIGTTTPTQKLEIEQGHLRFNQVAAPSAPTVAVNAAAGNLNGDYYYRISFVTALGETETGTASALVAPASQQVDLSAIPVGGTGVTARKIYRTTAGGLNVLMKLVATINDNVTTIYTDNIADGSLGVSESRVNTTGGIGYNGTVRTYAADPSVTILGYNAGRVNTGYSNSFMGVSAGYANTTGYQNSFMGVSAGYANTTGYQNNFMGVSAGLFNTTGYQNNFMGVNAGRSNTTGYQNSFMGVDAGYSNTTGYQNNFMGVNAGRSNTTGYSNSFMGVSAGRYLADGASANQTSGNSVFLGYDTRAALAGGSNEIVIGASAIGNGSNSVTLGNTSITKTILQGSVGIGTTTPLQKLDIEKGHIRLGQVAAPSAPTVATGAAGVLTGNYYYRISFVTALGETESGTLSALVAPAAQKVELTNIPVSSDSAVTSRRIYRTTTGGSTTSMKLVATIADNTTTTYSDNIADGSLGVSESRVNTTGGIGYNGTVRTFAADPAVTILGYNAGRVNTGHYNSFMGVNAGYYNTTGYSNSFMGRGAGYFNTTGYSNSFMGMEAGYYNTTGYRNSAIGNNALYTNTTGYGNSAMGYSALFSNTTGYGNSAMGNSALYTNNTGYYNSAVGLQALYYNTTGYHNSAMGYRALYSNTTGVYNSAMGMNALLNLAGAYHNNTALGYNAGRYQADGTTALATPSQSVYIGSGAMGYNDSDVNSIVIGYLAKGIGANSVVLGNDSITTTALKGNVGIGTTSPAYQLQLSTDSAAKPTTNTWTIASDQRIKKDIANFTDGLSTLLQLNPRTYKYNGLGGSGYDDQDTHIGFVAQEIEPIAPYMVETGKGVIDGIVINDFKSYQGHALAFILVNSIKEQQAQIDSIAADIAFLKTAIAGGGNAGGVSVEILDHLAITRALVVEGEVDLGKDSVGEAVIKAGAAEAVIVFETPYAYQPVVTISKDTQGALADYYADNTAKTGFSIKIDPIQTKDIKFSWHAFGGKNAVRVFSDGLAEPLDAASSPPVEQPAPAAIEPITPPIEPIEEAAEEAIEEAITPPDEIPDAEPAPELSASIDSEISAGE